MIQFPSDRPDYGKGHVAGSQNAADKQIAGNMKRAARLTAEEQRAVDEAVEQAGTVHIDGTLLVLIVIAIAGVLIGLALRGAQ